MTGKNSRNLNEKSVKILQVTNKTICQMIKTLNNKYVK